MPLKAGDKCQACQEGLLERSATGLKCTKCSFVLTIDEVTASNKREETTVTTAEGKEYVFKPRTFKIEVETPEEGEEFLRGLILARQNNNSEFFVDLIDAVNAILEPWRAHRLAQQMAARGG